MSTFPRDESGLVDLDAVAKDVDEKLPGWRILATAALDHGRVRVTTEASCYVLDFANKTVSRHPVQADASDLRKDNEAVAFIGVLDTPYIGQRLKLLLAGVSDDPNVQTIRESTPITKIEAL